jgi:HSP20 family protein
MARQMLSPTRMNDPFTALQRGMNQLFEDVFGDQWPMLSPRRESGGAMMPHMNVSENDNEIKITAELPGVAEKDVDITLDDDVLTIRGEKKSETKEEKESYHLFERSFGQFQRSLRVPHSVNPDEVKAQFENGILTVILPKNQAQDKTRHIAVQGASSH